MGGRVRRGEERRGEEKRGVLVEWSGVERRIEERKGGGVMKNTKEIIEIEIFLPPIQRCK